MAFDGDLVMRMMAPYEGARHSVVAFCHHAGRTDFIRAGTAVAPVSCDKWIFEIGSITKVFTAILLCLMVEEGKIDPHAPVRAMSADLGDVPDWITPQRLVSHTSGLPNYYMPMWKALLHAHPDGPYARFSRSDLLAWLQDRRGRVRPRRYRHAYSNLAMGLLGEAMAMMTGTPFPDLLAEKVIRPLALQDTGGPRDADRQSRFAHPKTPRGKPVAPWIFQSLAAAGYLRSSAGDLARFAGAVMRALRAPQTALDRAICRSVRAIHGLGPKQAMVPTAQCAGWLLVTRDPQAPGFLFHNGGTAGSSCALYICPARQAAFAILSNNGVAGNLWAGARLSWSDPLRQASDLFAAI